MAKKTIREAIAEAIKKAGKPLTIQEIYSRITKDNLYHFNSANPEHIVRTQLRRHSENLHFDKASLTKYFVYNNDGTYENKEI